MGLDVFVVVVYNVVYRIRLGYAGCAMYKTDDERKAKIELAKANWIKRRQLYGPSGRREGNKLLPGQLTRCQIALKEAGIEPPRDSKGHFVPGFSGNPLGTAAVRGRQNGTARIWSAIERALDDRDFDLFEHALTRAAVSDSVLSTLLNKLLPTKLEHAVTPEVLEEASGFCKGVIATVRAMLEHGESLASPQVKEMLEGALKRAEDLQQSIDGRMPEVKVEIEFVDSGSHASGATADQPS